MSLPEPSSALARAFVLSAAVKGTFFLTLSAALFRPTLQWLLFKLGEVWVVSSLTFIIVLSPFASVFDWNSDSLPAMASCLDVIVPLLILQSVRNAGNSQ